MAETRLSVLSGVTPISSVVQRDVSVPQQGHDLHETLSADGAFVEMMKGLSNHFMQMFLDVWAEIHHADNSMRDGYNLSVAWQKTVQ